MKSSAIVLATLCYVSVNVDNTIITDVCCVCSDWQNTSAANHRGAIIKNFRKNTSFFIFSVVMEHRKALICFIDWIIYSVDIHKCWTPHENAIGKAITNQPTKPHERFEQYKYEGTYIMQKISDTQNIIIFRVTVCKYRQYFNTYKFECMNRTECSSAVSQQ